MAMAKRPVTNLDERYSDDTDLELQVRDMYATDPNAVRMVIYAWLSEERKKQNENGKKWGWQFCPFDEGERVLKRHRELKLVGKITSIDRNYYDGDCLVLYVTLDRRSSKKWMARVDKNKETK
jgi:hypothetical protein